MTTEAECALTTDPSEMTHEALFNRTSGVGVAWRSDCADNWLSCYAQIGGEEWLPAKTYLSSQELTSLPYYNNGLCNSNSPLYNEAHCDMCEERMQRTTLALAVCAVLLEHILIVVKLLVLWCAPSTPYWVVAAEARRAFHNDQADKAEAGDKLAPMLQTRRKSHAEKKRPIVQSRKSHPGAAAVVDSGPHAPPAGRSIGHAPVPVRGKEVVTVEDLAEDTEPAPKQGASPAAPDATSASASAEVPRAPAHISSY